MAFPHTPILDTLLHVGAGANWSAAGSALDAGASAGFTANGAQGPGSAAFGASYWNPSIFGPDQEAFIGVATSANAGDELVMLLLRWDPAGSNGYGVEFDVITGTVHIYKIVAGAETQLLNPAGITATNGDVFGASIVGNLITGYKNGVELFAVTDTTYAAAGRIGFEGFSTTELLVNFGGGTVPVVPNPDLSQFPKQSFVGAYS